MKRNEYAERFYANLKIMSRTANGVLDTSASATKSDALLLDDGKKAKDIVYANLERAIDFLYDRRNVKFSSSEELEEFIMKLALITNEGIVKNDSLFRCGADSTKYRYAKVKDIPQVWKWFVGQLYCKFSDMYLEAEEIAAFCEYVINMVGHFFSDGCGKISMLMGMYVFMRYDLPCAKYTSRDEYYSIAADREIMTFEMLKNSFPDEFAYKFINYYKTLCKEFNRDYNISWKSTGENEGVFYIRGFLGKENCRSFERSLKDFYRKHPQMNVIFECRNMCFICADVAKLFVRLDAKKRGFLFRNLRHDCRFALRMAGLESHFDDKSSFPQIDVSKCSILGEGANGIIYKVDDETIAKVSKKAMDLDDCQNERICLKHALLAGVPAPISLGYADADGKPAVMMELINSKSLVHVLCDGNDHDDLIRKYANMVKSLHQIKDAYKLEMFNQRGFEKEILLKADLIDEYLEPEEKGLARKIIESIDEPECLIHGDIQPGNIMLGNGEMLFVDFDTFSTGKSSFDLGALYRTLFTNVGLLGMEQGFLKIPENICRRIWEVFVEEYYKGESEEMIHCKMYGIKTIAYVLALARQLKKNPQDKYAITGLSQLKKHLRD